MLHRYAYLWWNYRQRVGRFLRAAERAREIQQRVLLRKLRRHGASEFGRTWQFDKVRSTDDFRRQLPITTYEDYRRRVPMFIPRVVRLTPVDEDRHESSSTQTAH